jgi:leucyl aminopeptidase
VGVFSNNEQFLANVLASARASGEKFWPMPLQDDYREAIKSDIADIRNTGSGRGGGAVTAAMFLKEFVDEIPWVHLDIAGTAWLEEAKPYLAKGPTGVAVRALIDYILRLGAA